VRLLKYYTHKGMYTYVRSNTCICTHVLTYIDIHKVSECSPDLCGGPSWSGGSGSHLESDRAET
jgi:hypothetical protein